MKKRIFLVIALIALLTGGYYWHNQQPEQQVNGVVDSLIDAVEYDTAIFRQRSDVHDAIREIVEDPVAMDFDNAPQFPQGEMTFEGICKRLDSVHTMTTLREFTELDRTLFINGSEAQVTRTMNMKFAVGKFYDDSQTWKVIFDLKLSDRWRITGIRGEQIQN